MPTTLWVSGNLFVVSAILRGRKRGESMADEKVTGTQNLKVPGRQAIPFVVVKKDDGTVVLRHPDELEKAPAKVEEVEK